jgi:maltooligosyltrehalose trehalohydrolase
MTHRAHRMPFGAEAAADGVTFNFYAPDAETVELIINGREPIAMDDDGGWKRAHVSGAGAGDDYRFRLPGGLHVPDPASRHQPLGVTGPSRVVDPHAYAWRDSDWRGRPWSETVIYEAHVGTLTEEGEYSSFARRLDELADLGVTAVELMPLAEWRGARNWGYDGVLPFAPASAYGAPDQLKALIDQAHALGMMVFLDVVYNHFGPSGNYLHTYARSFFTNRHATPWGSAINFDDADREAARSFFVHNALYWIHEYNFDGLRLDAVHAIFDDSERHILAEISKEVRRSCADRHVHLILENDNNEAHWLERAQDGVTPLFYTAQWNDDLHHCWHTLLTGERDGYYADFASNTPARIARALAEGFVYQGDASTFRKGEPRGEPSAHIHPAAFIDFLQNHDQVGNRAFGERLDAIADPNRIAIARAALLLSPHIPMLFMGEEWGARTPFLYFVDFADEPELAEAVRAGRQNEFAGFAEFASGAATIPDPNAIETFRRSRVDDSDVSDPEHARVRAQVRHLLRLRRDHVTPLLESNFLEAHASTDQKTSIIDVSWRFSAGSLRFVINLGLGEVEMEANELDIIYASAGVTPMSDRALMPPWSLIAVRS